MPTWPGSLPQYMELDLSETRQQGFIRSSNDTGPAKQRRRFTATSRYLTGTMVMSKAQRDTFETFYTTTISEGSDEFDMGDPLDFSVKSMRFREAPEMKLLTSGGDGGHWRVSLSLEIMP